MLPEQPGPRYEKCGFNRIYPLKMVLNEDLPIENGVE